MKLSLQGLAAVPPDWMKNCQYNGTQKVWVRIITNYGQLLVVDVAMYYIGLEEIVIRRLCDYHMHD